MGVCGVPRKELEGSDILLEKLSRVKKRVPSQVLCERESDKRVRLRYSIREMLRDKLWNEGLLVCVISIRARPHVKFI